MTTAQIKAPPNTRRLTVKPGEIRPGDLMRDLGRLREVNRVETLSGRTAPTLHLVQFVDDPSELGSLGITDATQVTVWRSTAC